MLKKSIILLCIAIISLNAYSQSNKKAKKSPQEIAIEKTNEMKGQLGLTEKQAEQVKSAILAKALIGQAQNKRIKQSNKTIKNANKIIAGSKREYREKLNTILTDDQKKKRAEIREQNKIKKEGEKSKKK